MYISETYLKEIEVGRSWNIPDDKFDPEQLRMGIEVEMEHIPNGTPPDEARKIAAVIAKDHLREISRYYTYLKKMEKEHGVKEGYLFEKSKIRIPVEKGDLGLSLDDPLNDYKKQVTSGDKTWDELSKQLNILSIYNKNNHPEIASKARKIRNALSSWIDSKRDSNPEFGK